jgi:hypothetical protein
MIDKNALIIELDVFYSRPPLTEERVIDWMSENLEFQKITKVLKFQLLFPLPRLKQKYVS